ncbi:Retinoblastoma-like protein 1 [Microtus ochrogaster]|uniref:Retinoblastoma-like protein 1 n=1 Tax=Microtus ochrogaster TaxID=79684 RepID=A0A8J6L0R3_MICOH|nr:Retinoblastoma-like protein 1 [Microtus ochrogaster]
MFEDDPQAEGAAVVAAAREALQALCQELNLDEGSAAEALDDFTAIRGNYSLEGEVVHWLACSLYVACRKSIIPTVGKGVMEGNCVSLTRILRSAKLRRIPCSVKDLFNFCWTLFVYTKGNFRMIGDDLVNSYHLLLCCLDLIFANAIMCPNRRDLLNPSFKGLPSDFHAPDFKAAEEPPCIIAVLCDLHDGLLVEAKGIKEHYFKPYISKLFDKKILKGECLLDLTSFTDNSKAVNKEYEEYVLTVGDFDERIFLGADAEEEIGTPRKFTADTPFGKLTSEANVEYNLQQHFEKKQSFAPSTPLTGRRYLQEKEAITTPVASATQSVSRLQSIVTGLKNAPSEQLLNIFESCMRNPMENITRIVKGIGETFCQHYTQSTDKQPGSHIDFAVNRLKLAEILYYKILETIMVQETRRLHGMDMSVLLEQDIFHRSLMACCLEIVLFAYSSPRTFPWIIEVLDLQPFYFYKVIEVVIRSEEGLSRDMVKHLNNIEEQILESLAWNNNSALWEALHASANKVPTCEEVIFPNNFEIGNGGNVQGHLPMMPMSPIIHPRVKEVRTDSGSHRRGRYKAVYHLASVRLRDLCLKLDVSNELRRKIWTCFEFTLVHCPDLMKDRHLDQLLLCAFYIMAKVTKEERTFQEIMKSYRNQPQANSHVYRSVLLKSIPREVVAYSGDCEMTDGDIEDATKTPNCSSEPVKEERGDLIKFYNTIYVGRVKSFALKYDLSNQDHIMDAPPLSPFPHIKQQPGSPRRISQKHSIYVSPHKNGSGLTPRSALLYKFNGSPSKSLKDINNMIRQGDQKTKKRVIAISGDAESPAKRLCQENDDVLLKRLQDVVSERANH